MKTQIVHPQTAGINSAPRILVIEDEPQTRKLLALLVRGKDFEVETVSTGEDGLRAANEKDFALILSDIDLPGIDGFEVCRQIKQNPQLHSVPIILMSGRLAEATEPLALQLGAADYLPVASSRAIRLGALVATIGFPDVALQGFAPKLARGEIAAISGFRDDPRYFQISVPVQPGNSGGALVDERGNVVGVVCAKLSAVAAILTTGAIPENVNYAVKSTFLLGFLEAAPEVAGKLKKENARTRKFDDVIKSIEEASALVNVY
jgi:CheY-like chemotaxis protein